MISRPAAVGSKTLVAAGLNFPTSLAFGPQGTIFVAESGLSLNGVSSGGRILQIVAGGDAVCLKDGLRAPVNGLTWHDGALYIAEGGQPGRISRLVPGGRWTSVLDGLPGGGNYHTNEVAFDRDGRLYFGQGAMTNSGVVGPDSLDVGWLKRLPHPHDIPGLDVELTGVNARTDAFDSFPAAVTGPFAPFGCGVVPGQRIAGRLPCTSAVMRCRRDGSSLELVAWGLRNPYGLGFLPDGRLLALDLGMNDRGSRPVGNGFGCLYEVESGWWYGWPDFVAGHSVTEPQHRPQRGRAPRPLVANPERLPPLRQPLVRFPVHSAPVKFAINAADARAWDGRMYVACFGDKLPLTGPAGENAGRYVAVVDSADWSCHPLEIGSLSRPIDLEFHPVDGTLHVLDFGTYNVETPSSFVAELHSGKLWRVELDR